MSVDLAHIRQVRAEADCLFNNDEVEAAIGRVAEAINRDLGETNPVVFCVMNGGLIFSGKLLPLLDFPLELSYLHATRYRNETSGGELFWKAKPEISFIDRDVLIIDDILDEGHTLSAIIDFCKHAGARAVHTAVLVDKEHERKARPDLKASFTGLYCADRYVFGYGMGYKGYWRNAAGIFAVKGALRWPDRATSTSNCSPNWRAGRVTRRVVASITTSTAWRSPATAWRWASSRIPTSRRTGTWMRARPRR